MLATAFDVSTLRVIGSPLPGWETVPDLGSGMPVGDVSPGELMVFPSDSAQRRLLLLRSSPKRASTSWSQHSMIRAARGRSCKRRRTNLERGCLRTAAGSFTSQTSRGGTKSMSARSRGGPAVAGVERRRIATGLEPEWEGDLLGCPSSRQGAELSVGPPSGAPPAGFEASPTENCQRRPGLCRVAKPLSIRRRMLHAVDDDHFCRKQQAESFMDRVSKSLRQPGAWSEPIKSRMIPCRQYGLRLLQSVDHPNTGPSPEWSLNVVIAIVIAQSAASPEWRRDGRIASLASESPLVL
jgi:hypothetical protein